MKIYEFYCIRLGFFSMINLHVRKEFQTGLNRASEFFAVVVHYPNKC